MNTISRATPGRPRTIQTPASAKITYTAFSSPRPSVTRKSRRSSSHSPRTGRSGLLFGSNSTRGVNHIVSERSNGIFMCVRSG